MPQTEFLDMPMILPTRLLEFFFFLCCFGSPVILWLTKDLSAVELGYDVIKKLIILCRYKRMFS
jgi:hypothetical protein